MAYTHSIISGSSTNYNDSKLNCLNNAAAKLAEYGFNFTVLTYNIGYFTLNASGHNTVYIIIYFESSSSYYYSYVRKSVPTSSDYKSDCGIYSIHYGVYNFSTSNYTMNNTTVYTASLGVGKLETNDGDVFAYIGLPNYVYSNIAPFSVGYVNVKTYRFGDGKAYLWGMYLSNSSESRFNILFNPNGYIANISYSSYLQSAIPSNVDGIMLRHGSFSIGVYNGTTGDEFGNAGMLRNIYYGFCSTISLNINAIYVIDNIRYLFLGGQYFLKL